MAAITPADQSESSVQPPVENGTEGTVAAPEKPRARLGETEVVQLHNSDSEDEGDEVTVGENGEEEAFNDPDFLQDYPDDTTASPSLPLSAVPEADALCVFRNCISNIYG